MDFSHILSCALDVGEHLLVSGAEIYRVEDCICRICVAYGATDVDVFTITSSIVATVEPPGEQRLTQTRRIGKYDTNLERVDQLNQLSREMCRTCMDYEEFQEKFQKIMRQKRYSHKQELFFYAMVAAAFTLFFGGTVSDAAVSAVIGMALKVVVFLISAVRFNHLLSNLSAAFVLSILAFLSVRFGLAEHVDMIVIGNIMLLIPGVALTNSLRDVVSGDTMSGLLRFLEAVILAMAIAAGYILAAFVMGGVSL